MALSRALLGEHLTLGTLVPVLHQALNWAVQRHRMHLQWVSQWRTLVALQDLIWAAPPRNNRGTLHRRGEYQLSRIRAVLAIIKISAGDMVLQPVVQVQGATVVHLRADIARQVVITLVLVAKKAAFMVVAAGITGGIGAGRGGGIALVAGPGGF